MKKLLLVISVFFISFGYAQVKLPSPIIPNDSSDTYPIAFTEHLLGTIKIVQNYDSLFTLPIDRLQVGNLATVIDSSYELYSCSSLDPLLWISMPKGNSILDNIQASDTLRWGYLQDLQSVFDESGQTFEVSAYNFVIEHDGGNVDIKSTNGTSLTLGSDYGDITFGNENTGLKFSDNRIVKKGLEYNADYSLGFTDRSLIDKGASDTWYMTKASLVNPNLGIGYNTLNATTTGISNTAIGYGVLQSSNGDYNTGLGNAALWSNTTGDDNTAIGQSALALNISGERNTAVGKSSLYYADDDDNISIGYAAGQNTSDGIGQNINPTQSIYIGNNTLSLNDDDENSITLGHGAKSRGSNKVVIGNPDITDIYMGEDGQSVIHTDTIWFKDGTYQPTASAGLEKIGDSAWRLIGETPSLKEGYTHLNDLEVNGKIGITGTGLSVYIGEDVGENDDYSYNYNVGIGYQCLTDSSAGTRNVGIGLAALRYNIYGDYNIAIGYNVMRDNTTGNDNTAIGKEALEKNTTGSYNVALGRNSFSNILTGNFNVAIGNSSGTQTNSSSSNTASDNSVFLGAGISVNAIGETNQIGIGYDVMCNGSNTATIGNDFVTDVWFGGNSGAITHASKYTLNSLNTAPASATAAGTVGEIRITETHIYWCIATDTWIRAAGTTW